MLRKVFAILFYLLDPLLGYQPLLVLMLLQELSQRQVRSLLLLIHSLATYNQT